jgi:acyl carrier protein
MKDQEGSTGDMPTASDAAAPAAAKTHTHTEAEIQAWLISNIATLVEIDPKNIDIAKPLEYYGMDSMQAMHLSGDLADWLGSELSPTVVWDYPTIELLARHLAGNDQ